MQMRVVTLDVVGPASKIARALLSQGVEALFFETHVLASAEVADASWEETGSDREVNSCISIPVGYLISKLSSSERRIIRNSIPSQAIYFKAALEAFWSLKITMDFDSIDNKIKEPDFLRGLPLFNNDLFKIHSRNKSIFHSLNYNTISCLINDDNGLFYSL